MQQSPLLKEYKAEFMLLLVTITWGISFPLLKILLNDISPFMLVFVRFSITLLVFAIIYYKRISFRNYSEWKCGIVLGLFLFLGYMFQTLGMVYTTASKSAFITGINLIFIPFMQFIILKLRPGVLNVAGAILVLTGLYIFTGSHIEEPNIGDILTIFCAVSFAVHIVLLSKYSAKVQFEPLAFGQFAVMCLLGGLSTLFLEDKFFDGIRFQPSALSIFYLLFLALISTLFSLILMIRYQKFTTPFRAGIIYNFEAVFASVFAYFLLGEILTSVQLIAVIIMTAGLITSELSGIFRKRISETS